MVQHDKKTPEVYEGRAQSFVKHEVLKHYLLRCALIVGRHWPVITYIDGFSGPWNAQSDKLDDASFCIALEQLRKARSKLNIQLRCFFIEADAKAYAHLKQFAKSVSDAEVETRNCEFEAAIPDILEFVKAGGPKSFPFIFIDPKGWKGFAMKTIQPLLQLKPGEILVNFMTSHIKRFVVAPEALRHDEFEDLFGSSEYRNMPKELSAQEKEDWLVKLYMRNLQRSGNFSYVCAVMVLNPEKDATHFHLIYATRHIKGVEVFKEVEKKAMELQEHARAEAQQQLRERRTEQFEMFSAKTMHRNSHYDALRERYRKLAQSDVQTQLVNNGFLDYEAALMIALLHPLVWESDLKEWLTAWRAENKMRIDGLKGKERGPMSGRSHRLVWLEGVDKPRHASGPTMVGGR